MALPKIEHKLFEHELVGMKKKVKFRAFTVKEQKILLQTKEETDDNVTEDTRDPRILLAVSQIITNCTMGKIDPDNLCTFDLEDLFIRLRAKSVGEQFVVRYRETYLDEEDREQTNFIPVVINLDEVKVQVEADHTNVIPITDKIGVVMRYPTFGMLSSCLDSDDLTMSCIESIYNGDELHDPSTEPREQLVEFYDSIDAIPLAKMKKFFDTMPRLKHEVTIKLHDGTEEVLKFEGLESFFA